MECSSILWRRLDAPGHDACRLEARGEERRLEGTAVWLHEGVPARLAYQVESDAAWRSRRGTVRGWIGAREVALEIVRSPAGAWTLDGATVDGLEDCADLDLGFTPATNLLVLRRLDLAVGSAARASVAWLDVDAGTLVRLPQDYARRSPERYAYASPDHGYAAELEVAPNGFVRRYPGLWEALAEVPG
jgi:hypothetical protein